MKKKHIIIFLFVILLAALIFLFRHNIKALSITLIIFSSLALIITLLFEGELKAKKEEKRFLNLTGVGLFLLIIFVITSILNGYISIRNIKDNENKSYQDSLRFANKAYNDSINTKQIIDDLKTKRVNDSTEVLGLKLDIRRIDTTLVKNALIEIKEQRQQIELENENTYILFKKEVKLNLYKILILYDDNNISNYRDTTLRKSFSIVNLNEEYINKFLQLSYNSNIKEYIMNTITTIRMVNSFRQTVFNSLPKDRNFQIDKFVVNKEAALNLLLPLYNMTENLTTYKDFIGSEKIYGISNINQFILKDNLLKKFKKDDVFKP